MRAKITHKNPAKKDSVNRELRALEGLYNRATVLTIVNHRGINNPNARTYTNLPPWLNNNPPPRDSQGWRTHLLVVSPRRLVINDGAEYSPVHT